MLLKNLNLKSIRTRITLTFIFVIGIMALLLIITVVANSILIRQHGQHDESIVNEQVLKDNVWLLVEDAYNGFKIHNYSDYYLRLANITALESKIEAVLYPTSETKIAFRGLKTSLEGVIKEIEVAKTGWESSNQISDISTAFTTANAKFEYVKQAIANLFIVETKNTADIVRKTERIQIIIIVSLGIIVILTILGIIVMAISFSRKITAPLIRLTELAKGISKGNLDLKVDKDLIKNEDETGILSSSFDIMLKRVNTEIDSQKKISKDLEESRKVIEGYNKTLQQKVEERTKDLTKAYEDLKKMDKLKDDFINIAAHELKTPLIPIIGYTDLLREIKDLPKEAVEKVEIISRSAIREQKLVDDVLAVSKLESGTMDFQKKDAQIIDIIKQTAEEIKPMAEKKGLDLKTELPAKLPMISVDEWRTAQVLRNLISNAIKFTEKGGVTVSARQEKNDIIVDVKDTGIGVKPEDMPRLFEKFFQGQSGADRKYEGTGLGLPIAKMIVERQGGKIWVNTELGKGSVFSFSFPVKK
jgi:signal transduction histidine kinase